MFRGIHFLCRKLRDRNWIDYLIMRGERANPDLSRVLIYKKYQKINLCLLRPKKMDKKFSDEHRSTPLPGKTQPKSEKKSMPLPSQT